MIFWHFWGCLLFLDVREAALLLFAVNSSELIASFELLERTPVVPVFFAVLLLTARFTGIGSRAAVFFMQISGLWLNGCDRAPLVYAGVGIWLAV
jgi:hypothetical protein